MVVVRVLLVVAAISSLPSLTISSLVAYDCSSFTPDKNVDITDILPQCDAIRDYETVGVTIFQPLGETSVIGYRCKVTFTQTLVDVGSSRVVSNGTETLSRDECLRAHETKTINITGGHVPFLDTNGTVNHTIRLPDKTAGGNHTHQYHYLRTYEITLSENLGKVDLKQNIVRFGDVVCDNDGYTCHDDQLGQIFWQPAAANEQMLIYQGTVVLVRAKFPVEDEVHYVVISHLSSDEVFVVKSYDVSRNGGGYAHRIFRAAYIPNTYIMETDEAGYYGGYWGWHTGNILRASYSEPHYGQLVQAVDVVKRCCEREKQHQYHQLKSLPMHSSITFPEKGLMGTKGREHIVIARCAQTTVTARQTEECFREIPVRDQHHRAKFLDADTRVLSSQAQPIPCSPSIERHATLDFVDNRTSGTVKSPPSPIIEANVKSAVDWVKIVALVIIGCWGSTILVRLARVSVYCYTRCKEHRTEEAERTPIFSVSMLVDMLKPPFMKDSFKWKRHDNNEPDLNVSYAA